MELTSVRLVPRRVRSTRPAGARPRLRPMRPPRRLVGGLACLVFVPLEPRLTMLLDDLVWWTEARARETSA